MIITKLNISFYKKIKNLINKNGFEIPKYYFWTKLWKNNKKEIIGDGIFLKNKLVGYHSYFEKKLVYNRKIYKILVSSNWNVNKKYRNYSIFLINKFFRKKNVILLTTTANFKVSEIWKSLGAKEINNYGSRKIYFRILNNNNFINIIIKRKGYNLLYLFKPLLVFLLFTYQVLVKIKKLEKKLNYKIQKYTDDDIENFNVKYEMNSKFPIEKRSENEISNYLNIIKHNKEIFVIKIYKKYKFVGYSVLVKEKIKQLKIFRMYLAEIRLENSNQDTVNEIFEYLSEFSKKKNCALIEYRNLKISILSKLYKENYFLRHIENNPYLIKINSSLDKKVNESIRKNWETSFLDGDCLL
tara:strand:+ start:51 stop:1115 length:1065 start_codon:yes stop_codon:yes gene_type:complete